MSEPPPWHAYGQQDSGRWNAVLGLSPAQRAAVLESEAATSDLRRLHAGVLATAGQLKPVTIEALLVRSGSRLRGAA